MSFNSESYGAEKSPSEALVSNDAYYRNELSDN